MKLAARLLLPLALPVCCLAVFGCGSAMMTSAGPETPDWTRFQASLPAPPPDVAEKIAKLETELRSTIEGPNRPNRQYVAIQLGEIGLKFRLPESTIVALTESIKDKTGIQRGFSHANTMDVGCLWENETVGDCARISFLMWQLAATKDERERIRLLWQGLSDTESQDSMRQFCINELIEIESPEIIPYLAAATVAGAPQTACVQRRAVWRLGDFFPATREILLSLTNLPDDHAANTAEENLRQRGLPDCHVMTLTTWKKLLTNPGSLTFAGKDGRSATPRTIQGLTEELKSPDWLIRRRAADGLGRTEEVEAVKPLATAIEDPDWLVRVAVASALGQIESPEAAPLLRRMIEDGNWLVRKAAAEGLGKHHDKEAVAALVATLDDWNLRVRREVASALGKTGSANAVQPLIALLRDSDRNIQETAVLALGHLKDKRAVPALVELARSGQCSEAFEALGQIGDADAIPALVEIAMKNEGNEFWVRYYYETMFKAIYTIGAEHATALLVKGLSDKAPEVRARSAEILGQLASPASVRPLLAALCDENEEARAAAAEALGLLTVGDETGDDHARVFKPAAGHPLAIEENVKSLQACGAVEALIGALSDKSDLLKRLAAQALGRIRDPRAAEPLRTALLKTSEQNVRDAIANALKVIGEGHRLLDNLNDKDVGVRAKAAAALGTIQHTAAIGPLTALLDDANIEVRRAAVKALGQLKAASAADRMISLLDDNDNAIADFAAESLMQMGCVGRAVDIQLRRIKDADAKVRTLAVRALGNLHDGSSATALLSAISDPAPGVRAAAVDAMSLLQVSDVLSSPQIAQAMAKTLSALKDSDASVRAEAAQTLGFLQVDQAAGQLIAALSDKDAAVRAAAADALGCLHAPQATEPLLASLKDKDAAVRAAAAQSLGYLNATKALKSLHLLLTDDDGSVRFSAAHALGKIKDPRSVEPLIKAIKDTDEAVVISATYALGNIGDMRAVPAIEELSRTTSSDDVRQAAKDSLALIQNAEKGRTTGKSTAPQ